MKYSPREGELDIPEGETSSFLEKIFENEQNEVTPRPVPSASVGDIISLENGREFKINDVGFIEISKTTLEETPISRFELWEVDTVHEKPTRVSKDILIDKIEDARDIAKKLAEGWCADEKPKGYLLLDGSELWIGDSDFGILIRKVITHERRR